jgi:hypothetical protein
MINEYLFFLAAVSLSLVFCYAALRDFKWAILFVAAKWILIVFILEFKWVSEITSDGLKYIRLIEFYIHNNISIIHAITSFEYVYAISGNTFHFGYPLIYSDILQLTTTGTAQPIWLYTIVNPLRYLQMRNHQGYLIKFIMMNCLQI